jgi:hypothetical protein
MIQDADFPIRLKDRLTVIFRTFGLGAVVMRGVMEQIIVTRPDDEFAVGRSKVRAHILNAWLREEGLMEEITPYEKRLLQQKEGTWEPDDRVEISWRVESVGVLLWALNKAANIPAYDRLFNTDSLFDALPILSYMEGFLRDSQLRPINEIRQAREAAEVWHWRARAYDLMRAGVSRIENQSLTEQVKALAEVALEAGVIGEIIGDDFPAFGKTYRDLSEEEHQRAFSIAQQRHLALNWLCGYGQAWETTPTNT